MCNSKMRLEGLISTISLPRLHSSRGLAARLCPFTAPPRANKPQQNRQLRRLPPFGHKDFEAN